MNIQEIPNNQCCGCSACASICAHNAIVMKPDRQGFLYPSVVLEKCIDCGLCLYVCQKANEGEKKVVAAYAAKNTNNEVLKKSSSGGVGHALCAHMIEIGGTVYGVAYDDHYQVITCRAEILEECEKFFGSKYVQTNPGQTFLQVYNDLKKDIPVLFFGTSCHIAGLLSFCRMKQCKMDRLITVDLICHGVPSPKIFSDYISFLKRSSRFEHFSFRTKKKPWGSGSKNYGCTIYYSDGREITDSLKARLFLNLFFSNNCLRPQCYGCNYASLEKPADITIADYWGLQETHPDFFSEDGVSAVITHTEKGDLFFREARELSYISSSVEKIAVKQGNIGSPSQKSKDYNAFWDLYYRDGFMAIAKKYGGFTAGRFIKNFARTLFSK